MGNQGPLASCLRATDLSVCLLITATRLHRFGCIVAVPAASLESVVWIESLGLAELNVAVGLGVVTC